jgi:hypothetical protein
MRSPRIGDIAVGKVGTFGGSENLQFSEGGFANPPRNGDSANPHGDWRIPISYPWWVYPSWQYTLPTPSSAREQPENRTRKPPKSQFKWNGCFPQPMHGATQATALASALVPRKTELAEAVSMGAARGRPAGPPLLPLRSPCAVATKPPDMRVHGPLTREARHPKLGRRAWSWCECVCARAEA